MASAATISQTAMNAALVSKEMAINLQSFVWVSDGIKLSSNQDCWKGVCITPFVTFVNVSPRLFACSPNAFNCICTNSV